MFKRVVFQTGHLSGKEFLSAILCHHSPHAYKWNFISTFGSHRQGVVLSSALSFVNSNLFQTTQRNMTSPASVPRKETKVGAHLVYHQYHPEETESHKTPIVMFLPWITANQRSAQRFEDLYGSRGFNVLTLWSTARHFLWPKSALPLANEVLTYLLSEVKSDLVIHGMSIGAYIYSIILIEALKNQEAVSYLNQRVKGNIFDSLVCGGLNQMAIGVSKLIFKNFILEKVFTTTLLSYFTLTKPYTVQEYDKITQQFIDNPFTPSALIFYSTVDPMSDPNVVEYTGQTWGKRSAHIQMKKWDDAGHVQLFKKHPKEYVERLDEYIDFIRPSVRPYKPVVAKL